MHPKTLLYICFQNLQKISGENTTYSVYLNEHQFQKLLPQRCSADVDKHFHRWGITSHNPLEKERACSMLLIHSVHEGYYSWWDIGCNNIISNVKLVCQKRKDIPDNYRSAVHPNPTVGEISMDVRFNNTAVSSSLASPHVSCQPGQTFIGKLCVHLVACCIYVPFPLPPHIAIPMNDTGISDIEHVQSTLWSFLDIFIITFELSF